MNDETTVYRGSPSLFTQLGPVSVAMLVLVGSLAGLIWMRDGTAAVLWVLGALAIASLGYLLVELIILKSTHYEVTSERIRIRRGILTKRTEEVELYRASDISLVEPLSQRLAGLGTIEVRTMEQGNPLVRLEAVRGAHELRETLRKHIEECRERKRVLMMELEDQPRAGH